MSNMSYCRFENTLADLEDCVEALEDHDISSRGEREHARTMADACEEYVKLFKTRKRWLDEQDAAEDDEEEDDEE